MKKQSHAPSRAVLYAAILVVLAGAVFAAAFYYLDGDSITSGLIARFTQPEPEPVPAVATPGSDVATPTLELPGDMPDEFALNLWQEQLNSQRMISRLVDGDVKTLEILKVDVDGDAARLESRVVFTDGTDSLGEIGMRRFAEAWYVAYASARRGAMESTESVPLPAVGDVDTPLLNTVIAEQSKSATITREYVEGKISRIDIGTIKLGPNVAAISVVMHEDDETSKGTLVAIKHQIDGKDVWMLARFDKTGSTN
jgi:hypothetical protein